MSDSEQQNEAADLLQSADDIVKLKNAQDVDRNGSNIDNAQEQYNKVLAMSCSKTRIVIGASLVIPLLTSTRYYVMELYMESISSADTSIISTIIFSGFVWFSIASFIAAWLGDKYGHDKMLLITFLFNGIGVFIEAISNNLLLFSIGYFINRIAVMQITMAYIAWILPHKYAINYMSKFFSMGSIIYLLGPIIAGFIVDISNYRNIFWLNCIILCLCILTIMNFIIGSQNKLQKLQRDLSDNFVNQQENDDIFPICNIKNNDDINTNSWSIFFKDIDKYKLILLSISIIQNCVCWTIEAIVIFYYALFIINRFKEKHLSLLYISTMLIIMTAMFGVANILIPKLIKRIIPKYTYIITISCFLNCILMFIAMNNIDIIFYWLINLIGGITFGIMCIGTEMCILEMQPKQHSGKVSGIKESFKILLRAFGILIVGLFWNQNTYYNSLWYAMFISSLIILVLSFFILWFSRFIQNG